MDVSFKREDSNHLASDDYIVKIVIIGFAQVRQLLLSLRLSSGLSFYRLIFAFCLNGN